MPANKRGGGRYYNQNHGRNQNKQIPAQGEATLGPKATASPKKEPEGPSANIKQEMQPSAAEGVDVPKPSAPVEKKFTQRSRLFVGNLPINTSEQEFRDLFSKFGEISEIFVNSGKGFGFVRLDTRANAEKAKWELDGFQIKNRQLRVRFASHGAALSLKHLSPYVSNELLETAFIQFGPVERAVVIVDDRGRSTGRGIIEFARKSSATKALQQINEGCFLLTSSPQAVVAKPLEQEDTEDGLNEKNIPRNQQFFQEREAPPRFAQPGTFEYEFALRWKALDEMERQEQELLNKTISSAREKLEAEMENAIHDHKTMMMKQDLMRRQEELRRLEETRQREMERRKQMEFAREDAQKKEREALAKRQEILRAQVEGKYNHGNQQFEEQGYGNRNDPGGYGQGNQGMFQEALAHELAHEMMGGGQGGLGPAPGGHSSRNCPLTPSNMKKILGRSKTTQKEESFYKHALDSTYNDGCKNVGIETSSEHLYTRLPSCPNFSLCQTFEQWKFQIFTSKINRMFAQRSFKRLKLVLYFMPIGPFPDFIHAYQQKTMKTSLFELMCEFLRVFFSGSEVRLLPECDVSEIAAKSRHHTLTGKLQYYVSDLLTFLHKRLPADGFAIIGLTWHDLYPSENLNFVLGQGSSQHSACVSSFGRFDPNYVKGFKGREDGISPEEMKDIEEIDHQVLWKLMKVISHETCHVLGLSHCLVFRCLVNSSSSTEEALSQPLYLCPLCMSKIQHLKSSMCPVADAEKLTVKGHFSELLHFLQSVFESDGNEEATLDGRVEATMSWLHEMLNKLADQ